MRRSRLSRSTNSIIHIFLSDESFHSRIRFVSVDRDGRFAMLGVINVVGCDVSDLSHVL
jgi:hypothetical protein